MRWLRLTLLSLWWLAAGPARAESWFEVTPGDHPVQVNTSGIVVSTEVQRFGPPPNRDWQTSITQLVAEGARVRKGDILARFDGSNLDDRVRDITGELGRIRGELAAMIETQIREVEDEKVAVAAAESAADKANRKAEQPPELIAGIEYQKLVENKRIANLLWEAAIDRQQISRRVREARRQEREMRIEQLELRLQAAREELDGFTIRAPGPGLAIVGTDPGGSKLDVNTMVHPGIVVVELVNDERLAVAAEIPEHASARVAVGQRVRVKVDSAGGTELIGHVAAVANTVRRQSKGSLAMVRDISVALEEDHSRVLRVGMSVQVTVEVELLNDVLAIPDTALIYRKGAPGVILRGGGWQAVQLGERADGVFIVEGGLKPGQEVRL
ncbi:MAG: HlyD family efflux transporter periplasmic adaptor subunit [Proteobacteria bacterium]|nr:HlyD family efflux transporter periplasmic adaptor subunit [Pseudomonadota bacterium]